MRPVRASVEFASVVTALTLTVSALPASGAIRPGRAPLESGAGRATPLASDGQTPFVCGTYAGNQAEHAWRRALDARVKREVSEGKRVVTFPLDYVYDDVWIIEDDGTLTTSGVNLFDTDLQTFLFTPVGGGAYEITDETFSYDGTAGTLVFPGDDGHVWIDLPFNFPFGGQNQTGMFVGGNGMVSFSAVPNPTGYFDPVDFYNPNPQIAPFYLDLNPAAGGSIWVKGSVSSYTVTYVGVPEYGTTRFNTAQLVLYPSGEFTFTYNGIQSTSQLSGLDIAVGFNPGGPATFEAISFSDDPPHTSLGSAVYEAYYSLSNPVVNEAALFQRFYQQFPDDFFQLVFFTNFAQTMGGFANELNIKNDVDGLNLGIFDASASYGSNGVLESRCNMNRLAVWDLNPANRVFLDGNSFLTIMGQEAGHRWGAFVLFDDGGGPSNLILGRADAHWSYYADVDHSSLEGGNWELVSGSTYTCPTQIDYFSEVDEYLMGLRTPEEVGDFYYISSPSNDQYAARAVGTPVQGANATGTYVPVTAAHLIAANGPRTPAEPDEEHDLRQAFILLVAQGSSPTQTQLNQIAGFRSAWEDYFEKSCDGRLSCNTSITQAFEVAGLCGYVYNQLTWGTIPEFTAHSLERDFDQHVPDGGRYFFRYLADAGSGADEHVTVVFEATGFEPDTLEIDLEYGTDTCVNVLLTPIYTAAGESPGLRTALRPNVPNPFNPSTSIRYELASPGPVRLAIYDPAGRLVRTLVAGDHSRGAHAVVFDGRDDAGRPLASGVYFYRLDAGSFSETRKMVLLK